MLAAAASTDHSGVLCTILLIATIIALIIGLAEALGLTSFSGRVAVGAGRFGALLVAVILLVVYVIVC